MYAESSKLNLKRFWTYEEELRKTRNVVNNGPLSGVSERVGDVQKTDKMTKQVTELKLKLEEMEHDYKEARENIEFLTSELSVQAEELKESEDALAQEKELRAKDKELIERLESKCSDLDLELTTAKQAIEMLSSKFHRNREVWLLNEKKANDEIKKLDDIIDRVVSSLRDAEDTVMNCPPLRNLLTELTEPNKTSELEFIV
ncbi:hypothetical protein HDE_09724 [Halotydeus destructor]|nr:hypothetical protein HDE_09724 [Halotydeus destructor]